MDRGTIIAVFDRESNLEYSVITPHGRIQSKGSTIAMKVKSSKTHVLVEDGSANCTSSQGKSTDSEDGIGNHITPKEVIALAEFPDGENNTAELIDATRRLSEGGDALFQ